MTFVEERNQLQTKKAEIRVGGGGCNTIAAAAYIMVCHCWGAAVSGKMKMQNACGLCSCSAGEDGQNLFTVVALMRIIPMHCFVSCGLCALCRAKELHPNLRRRCRCRAWIAKGLKRNSGVISFDVSEPLGPGKHNRQHFGNYIKSQHPCGHIDTQQPTSV